MEFPTGKVLGTAVEHTGGSATQAGQATAGALTSAGKAVSGFFSGGDADDKSDANRRRIRQMQRALKSKGY